MKLWKQWAALVIAVLMVFMAVACAPAEQTDPSESQPTAGDTNATTEATEASTSEATDASDATEATIDLTPYQDYLGTWYADGSSAGYRFILNEDLTWQYADAEEESVFGGNFLLSEDCLNMYDPDGSLSVVMTLEAKGKIYAEIYTDSMMDMLSTSYFFNEITNNDSDFVPVGDDTSETIAEPTENLTGEDTIPSAGSEETTPEVGVDAATG